MRAFCFDLDDTLVSEREYIASGLHAAGKLIDSASGNAPGWAAEWLMAEWRRSRAPDIFQRCLCAAGLPQTLLPDLIGAYREHEPELTLREGALQVLWELHRRGDGLCLVSDGRAAMQRRKWRALGLAIPFHPVVFTDELGREFWKPHPRAFERVMAARPEASGFVYVADNVEKDFIAPNRLGWTTVRVAHPDNLRPPRSAEGDARPAHDIRSLTELLDLP